MEERAQSGKMPLRALLSLVGLTFSAFIFNTSEFVPVGLLTDIAGTFSLTEAQTGSMITVYAWAVALLSLPLMVAASRIEFKRLLLFVVALFGIGQVCSAAAPSFPVLVLSRLLVACAHAIFWSIASVIATRVAGARHGSLAISMIATGSSIAMIFGLPLGRAIGLMVGWRLTFACVGAIAFAVFAYLALLMPKVPAGEPFTLRRLPEIFRTPMLVALYVVTMLFATGYYTGYSYIEPYMLKVAHIPSGLVTVVLTVFGLAGLAGSYLFGRFYDGNRRGFMGFSVLGVAVCLAALRLTGAAGLPVALGACVLWGLCGTVFNVAAQSETIRYSSHDASAVAMSIFSGLFNVGIGAGSAVGGAVMTALSLEAVGFVGAAIAFAGFIIFLCTMSRWMGTGAAGGAGPAKGE